MYKVFIEIYLRPESGVETDRLNKQWMYYITNQVKQTMNLNFLLDVKLFWHKPGVLSHSKEDGVLVGKEVGRSVELGDPAPVEHHHSVVVHDRVQPGGVINVQYYPLCWGCLSLTCGRWWARCSRWTRAWWWPAPGRQSPGPRRQSPRPGSGPEHSHVFRNVLKIRRNKWLVRNLTQINGGEWS